MGIRKKLLGTFFTIIFILSLSEVFVMSMDYIIMSNYTALTNNMIAEYSLIGNIDDLLLSFDRRVKSLDDLSEVNNFDLIYFDTKGILTKLRLGIVDNNSKIAFSGLENNINDVFYNIEIGINNLNNGNYLEAIKRRDAAHDKNSFVKENATNLLLKELEYSKNLQLEIDKVRLASQIIALFLLLLTTGGSIWYAVIFSKKLVTPLIDLTKLAKVIEGGDYSATINKKLLHGGDEVAILANSFNLMVLSLKNSIIKLQEYNLEINNSHKLLQAEKNKLQKYLDVAGVIVLIFDTNNNVELINKKGRELLGIKSSEIIGKDWITNFVDKKNQTQTKGLLAFLINDTALSDTLENVVITKDNSERNIVWHFSVLKNRHNVPSKILATGVDATELTKAKITINQLKEVDNLKNEVLNIATHELKTPLISIVGLSEVMEKQPKTIPTEYQNFISIIHTEGLKLTNLIKTMLTVNRNDISRMAIVKEKFNLVDLILSIVTPLNVIAKRNNSQIKLDLQTKKVIIESDKSKISQVIYNFVDNAVKYGLKDQTIEINLFLTDDKFVKVEVVSTGAGISLEMQKKLFMKFSQLEPSLSRSQDGMGLGLYICKQNIENLGGQIGVFSEEGKGATFYFTLPL